ncbi:MAG: type 2 periplasmic-binding domain-containing protein [Eubacteriales bacterium]
MVKLCILLFIISMVLSASLSCTDSEKAISNASFTAANDSAETDTAAEPDDVEKLSDVVSKLPVKDYDGYRFIILTREESASPYWFTRDVFSEGIDGEPINDAVYQRNSLLEDKYNITILGKPSGASPAAKAKKIILAGEDSYAALTDGLTALSELATANLLLDYNTVPGITLEGDWWDQSMNDGMSIANKLYFVTGDISIMDNEGTWHILFNKDLQNDFNLENPYELVNNGDWTLQKMHEMAKSAASDVDGDGKMTPMTDRFGFASESYNTYALWVGGGMQITAKNENDLPVLSMNSEKRIDFLEKVLELQLDKNIFVDHNTNMEVFSSGTTMFQLVGMRVLPVYRQSETNFGILPLPKYDPEQEKYYTTYSSFNLTAYSVPVTTTSTERTGILLNALAAVSKYTLTPAYYDISLKGKYIRDDESAAMIDLILNNRLYDIGLIFNWGGTLTLFINMTDAGTYDFSSRYAKIEEKAIAEIEKFTASLQ